MDQNLISDMDTAVVAHAFALKELHAALEISADAQQLRPS